MLVACNSFDDVDTPSAKPVEVSIRAGHSAATRTTMGAVGNGAENSSQSINWAVGDEIMVWAKEQNASGYTLSQQRFKLGTYNSTYNDADFLATLSSPMDKTKTYNYWGLYPVTSVTNDPQTPSSQYVSFTLPATQNGKYNPALDVMVASASGCGLYERNGTSNVHIGSTLPPELNFKPLFHLMRIQIPEGGNLLGHPVKKLEITFPNPVVGQVSFDATSVDSDFDVRAGGNWSYTSNKITVELDDDNLLEANNGYIWLHVMPTTINGEVTIKAYSASGVKAKDMTFNLEKELRPQHITPISMTVPRPYRPVVNIDLTEIANYLGEDWNTIKLSGLNFVGAAADGSLTITNNDTKVNHIAVYPDVNADNVPDMSSVNDKTLNVTYDSEHALLTDKTITLPSSLAHTTEYTSPINTVNFEVPYLLYEDFNNVTDHEHFSGINIEDAIWMDSYGLKGWSGAKWETKNDYLIVGGYIDSSVTKNNGKSGRIDTSPLPLKDGKNVTISLSYTVKGWEDADNGAVSCAFGVTNRQGPIDGTNSWGNPAVPDILIDKYRLPPDGSNHNENNAIVYNKVYNKVNNNSISGCGITTRLSWCCHPEDINDTILAVVTGKQFYIAIDNIKVSIGDSVK